MPSEHTRKNYAPPGYEIKFRGEGVFTCWKGAYCFGSRVGLEEALKACWDEECRITGRSLEEEI